MLQFPKTVSSLVTILQRKCGKKNTLKLHWRLGQFLSLFLWFQWIVPKKPNKKNKKLQKTHNPPKNKATKTHPKQKKKPHQKNPWHKKNPQNHETYVFLDWYRSSFYWYLNSMNDVWSEGLFSYERVWLPRCCGSLCREPYSSLHIASSGASAQYSRPIQSLKAVCVLALVRTAFVPVWDHYSFVLC